MTETETTIVHISDVHLETPGPVPFRALLSKRMTGFLNSKLNRENSHSDAVADAVIKRIHALRPDHIICSGDLINIGLESEIERAREWLENLGPPEQVSLVPGNHDAYVKEAVAVYETLWRPYFGNDEAQDGEELFPFVNRVGNIAVIGVSTAVPTGLFKATGLVGTAQLSRLEFALRKYGEEGLFRIIVMHHPPAVENCPEYKQLCDRAGFQSVINRAGAELILHGHTHRPDRNSVPGPSGEQIPIYGVTSASSKSNGNGNPAAINIFSINRCKTGWICSLKFDITTPCAAIIE